MVRIYAKGRLVYNDDHIGEFQQECENLEEAVALFNEYTEKANLKVFNFTLNYRN